jgi:hypothetical protein
MYKKTHISDGVRLMMSILFFIIMLLIFFFFKISGAIDLKFYAAKFSNQFNLYLSPWKPDRTEYFKTAWPLFGTDPDRKRVTWETPSSDAIPSVESH